MRWNIDFPGAMNKLQLSFSDHLCQASTNNFLCKAKKNRGQRIPLSHSPTTPEETMYPAID